MQLIEMNLKDLNGAKYNPRINLEPGMEEFEKLRASIENFGCVEPIVWNKKTGNVVGGHQRLAVLRYLKKKKDLVSVVECDEEQEKLLNLALNKAKGGWDIKKLEELLGSLDQDSLNLTGFSMDEIAVLLEDGEGLEDNIDDLIGDDGDDYSNVNYYGASWLVTLKFPTLRAAREWAEKEGLDAKLKDGTASTVCRMGEEEAEE